MTADLITRAEAADTPEKAIAVFEDYRKALGDRAPLNFRVYLATASLTNSDTRVLGYLLLAALAVAEANELDWIVGSVNGHYGGTPYACAGSLDQHGAHFPCTAVLAAVLRAREAQDG